jgi:transcriptional regulator with XRE-family HTH domain
MLALRGQMSPPSLRHEIGSAVGSRLRRARVRAGVKLEDLAEALGVSMNIAEELALGLSKCARGGSEAGSGAARILLALSGCALYENHDAPRRRGRARELHHYIGASFISASAARPFGP